MLKSLPSLYMSQGNDEIRDLDKSLRDMQVSFNIIPMKLL